MIGSFSQGSIPVIFISQGKLRGTDLKSFKISDMQWPRFRDFTECATKVSMLLGISIEHRKLHWRISNILPTNVGISLSRK